MGLMTEFKMFAMRGNVIDLAVGVVIGAAFGKIVTSLVDNLVMPLIGVIVGGVNFSHLGIELKAAVMENGAVVTPAIVFKYGAFFQSIVDFTIIAFAVFLAIKAINRFSAKRETEPPTPAAPSDEVVLLTEIRDTLRANATAR